MIGQISGHMWASHDEGFVSFSTTVQVAHRDVFAEVALTRVVVIDSDWHLSEIGITQVVSDSGVEDFGRQIINQIHRKGVTSVTFGVAGMFCQTDARWVINIW